MEKTLTAEQLKILAYVRVCKRTHTGYLAKVAGMAYDQTLRILWQLEAAGRIQARGTGWVAMSESDQAALRALREGL